MISGPTHNLDEFEKFIEYNGPQGQGFYLPNEQSEIYIFDDYGGWVDKRLNYFNESGERSGFFDKDYNFYDMNRNRIPGGYKGGKNVEKKIQDKIKYLYSVPDRDKQKFVVELQNLPVSTTPSQITAYILERCNVTQDMIEECKKMQKDNTKGYVVVRGADIVQRLLILEGRRFRVKEKDGTYKTNEISIFVRESKFGIQKKKDEQMIAQIEMNSDFKVMFENLDPKKSDEEFINWICVAAVCNPQDVYFYYKKVNIIKKCKEKFWYNHYT